MSPHFSETTPELIAQNPFTLVGSDWMLITAEKDKKVNTMTASWGGMGVMWKKNVAFVVIRPQRFTKEFIDHASGFSLSFFEESFRDKLAYLGKVSGRNEDKITQSGLTVTHMHGIPCFQEAKLVFICHKLYAQPMDSQFFIDHTLDKQWYPNSDHHTLYVAEIKQVLVKN